MISPLIAAKAYAAAQAQGPGQPGEMLNSAMQDTIQQSRQAESQMIAGVQGKADLVNVVTAVSSAETSLQTVIAVRDQVISAYQQIMQMQI